MTASQTVTDLLDDYVVCRTIGHAWDEHPTPEVDSDLFRKARAGLFLRCTRCHTERFDYLTSDMTVGYRYYRYPEKYRGLEKGATRPLLRGEMFRRSLLLRKRGR